MDIGVFGASGYIGRHVVAEAARRGHRVTGFTRDRGRAEQLKLDVSWVVVDPLDSADVAAKIAGLDVVVNALSAGATPVEAASNAYVLTEAARAMLDALASCPATRCIVVGGSGSLEVQPGVQMVDVEGFAQQLERLGLPAGYVDVVRAHRDSLNAYRTSNRLWTYISAPVVIDGAATGRYRIGHDHTLPTADGKSEISVGDLAQAIMDEAETPKFIQRRFTLAY